MGGGIGYGTEVWSLSPGMAGIEGGRIDNLGLDNPGGASSTSPGGDFDEDEDGGPYGVKSNIFDFDGTDIDVLDVGVGGDSAGDGHLTKGAKNAKDRKRLRPQPMSSKKGNLRKSGGTIWRDRNAKMETQIGFVASAVVYNLYICMVVKQRLN